MKKITFNMQVVLGIILIALGNIISLYFKKGIFSNIAWILYGLMLIINPVYPEKYKEDPKKAILICRITGIICILIGILIR